MLESRWPIFCLKIERSVSFPTPHLPALPPTAALGCGSRPSLTRRRRRLQGIAEVRSFLHPLVLLSNTAARGSWPVHPQLPVVPESSSSYADLRQAIAGLPLTLAVGDPGAPARAVGARSLLGRASPRRAQDRAWGAGRRSPPQGSASGQGGASRGPRRGVAGGPGSALAASHTCRVPSGRLGQNAESLLRESLGWRPDSLPR